MKKSKGIPASNGIAIGPVFLYEEEDLTIPQRSAESPEQELARLDVAIAKAMEELKALQAKAAIETSADEAAIFEAHTLFLQDPTLLDAVKNDIQCNVKIVEKAWIDGIEANAAMMEALEDEYFRARAVDIRDVGQRVLRILLGKEELDLSSLNSPSIIVAQDLTPSDTVRMDKKFVLAFCTAEGGPTSHTAILAKALGLPAIVGVGAEILSAANGDTMIVDGSCGELILDPDEPTIQAYKDRRLVEEEKARLEFAVAQKSATTSDGHTVEIVANVGSAEDAQTALDYGAEGIGLLRTEFLYLDRATSPNEEEQLLAYTAVLKVMEKRPVVVRTLDAGGDKNLPYLDLGEEFNPFLGWRAIRMCLDNPDFFKVQLRSLLRSSPGHDVRIMFPMIATLTEVRKAKALLEEARAEVKAAGHAVAEKIQVGIMVEIPSTAVMADLFAKEVDFFSVGTNDLTQYTMAADRTNQKIAHLGDACHPAVLRQIQRVIDAGHETGIWIGVCGELAGDPDAVPILLGLGLDEFSMAPSSIPHAKATIRKWSMERAQALAHEVVNLDSAEAVREKVRQSCP